LSLITNSRPSNSTRVFSWVHAKGSLDTSHIVLPLCPITECACSPRMGYSHLGSLALSPLRRRRAPGCSSRCPPHRGRAPPAANSGADRVEQPGRSVRDLTHRVAPNRWRAGMFAR
jgi:hypothetical protein